MIYMKQIYETVLKFEIDT